MLPRAIGGRGRGGHGHNGRGRRHRVVRLEDVGQPHRNPQSYSQEMDDVSLSEEEYVDSTSNNKALGAYPTTPPPQ